MRPPPISVGCPTTSNAFSKKYAPTRRTPTTRVSRELLSTAPDSAFAATAVSVGRSGRAGAPPSSDKVSGPVSHGPPSGLPGGSRALTGPDAAEDGEYHAERR